MSHLPSWPFSQVLVTGIAGWLGRNLQAALAPLSIPVRGLVLPQEASAGDRNVNRNVIGDVRDPAACAALCRDAEGAILFHLAGVIHPRRVADFYRINVQGTRNVLAAAQTAGVQRVVVVSSNSPCGCNPHPDHRFDETAPYRPYLNYGRSKMQMEQTVQEIHHRTGLETVIVRAPWFYGPFQPPRQTLFFRMIREGRMPIVGNGQNRRSMVYLENLCQGLLLAATTPHANGQIYWIADERPYPFHEIVDTIAHLLDTEFDRPCAHRRWQLPDWVGTAAYAVDWSLQTLGLYHQKIHVLSEMNQTIACTIAKAQRELGYQPQIALAEGMRRSLHHLLAADPHALGPIPKP
ncbi:MAG: NAD-dependent epimerase/dehydratase family protein [Pseudanabaenaceae cyanobacterium]